MKAPIIARIVPSIKIFLLSYLQIIKRGLILRVAKRFIKNLLALAVRSCIRSSLALLRTVGTYHLLDPCNRWERDTLSLGSPLSMS